MSDLRSHVGPYFGEFGGRFVPESLIAALDELDALDLDTDLTDAVVVVEWGGDVVERLVERHLRVQLHREPESDVRTASWSWTT